MQYRFLIHDLNEAEADCLFGALPPDVIAFPAKPRVKHCVGCFGCWIKTPGKCVIQDRCADTPAMLGTSRELILVSRNVYGGLSPEVKAVVERSIGYLMPFFRIEEKEMHHTMRYENSFTITTHFYGHSISEEERDIGKQLVKANAVNLGAEGYQVFFHETTSGLKEAIR